jgi:hypothetical protein
MPSRYLLHGAPDVSSDQREAVETAKLIRKLRWIGKEDEARSMELRMTQLQSATRVSVLADPLSTD